MTSRKSSTPRGIAQLPAITLPTGEQMDGLINHYMLRWQCWGVAR
jgi:hypothetical protein